MIHEVRIPIKQPGFNGKSEVFFCRSVVEEVILVDSGGLAVFGRE